MIIVFAALGVALLAWVGWVVHQFVTAPDEYDLWPRYGADGPEKQIRGTGDANAPYPPTTTTNRHQTVRRRR